MQAFKTQFQQLFTQLTESFFTTLPQILLGVLLIIAGWLIAKLLKAWSIKLLSPMLNWVEQKITKSERPLQHSSPLIIGRAIFWVTWIFFLIAALQMVAKPVAATSLDLLVRFLPQLLAAVLIFFGGWIFGSVLHGIVKRALSTYGSNQADALGRVLKNIILFLTFLVVVNQLGFRVDLLIQLSIIIAAMIAGSFTLAFSFGAKTTIANMMASYYIHKNFNLGQQIKIDDIEGKILNLTRTQVVLDTPSGVTYIPAADFNQKWISVLKEPTE